MNVLNEAMRKVDSLDAQDLASRAIARELDPRELQAALDDAVEGVAIALLDKARALVIRRVGRANEITR